MTDFETSQHLRRSLRLPEYDYSQAGSYFVTICLQNRTSLFGKIIGPEMIPNDSGNMVSDIWHQIPTYYPGADIDEFVLMPNHIHGILVLGQSGQSRGIAPTLCVCGIKICCVEVGEECNECA